MDFMTPSKLVSQSCDYNEALIAVPNYARRDSEFDDLLEEPEPIAIYCYDKISREDIASAKKLGIGIIVVETKHYDVKREGRISMPDTVLDKTRSHYNYVGRAVADYRLSDDWFESIEKDSSRPRRRRSQRYEKGGLEP